VAEGIRERTKAGVPVKSQESKMGGPADPAMAPLLPVSKEGNVREKGNIILNQPVERKERKAKGGK